MMDKCVKSRIENYVLILIGLIGIIIRINQYIFNRSIWLDEAMLALNVIEKSLNSLLFTPLDFNQGSPIGFLLITKIMISIFSPSELTLRFLPLVSSIALITVSYYVAKYCFVKIESKIIFISLMAFSPVLIYYSSEFKQYSIDALVNLYIFLMGILYMKNNQRKTLIILVISSVILSWFSHITIFAMFSICVYLAVMEMVNFKRVDWKKWTVVLSVWIINFTILYLVSYRNIHTNTFLVDYWKDGYLPTPIFSTKFFVWLVDSILGMVHLSFFHITPTTPYDKTNWLSLSNIFFTSSFVFGMIKGIKNKINTSQIILLEIFVMLIVSLFHIYPFRNRMILFLIPYVYFSIAIITETLNPSRSEIKILKYSMFLIIVGFQTFSAFSILINPINKWDTKGGLEYILQNSKTTDGIAISEWSIPAYDYYQKIDPDIGLSRVNDVPKDYITPTYLASLCSTIHPDRIWFVFIHRSEEGADMLNFFKNNGNYVDVWSENSSLVFLVDGINENFCMDIIENNT